MAGPGTGIADRSLVEVRRVLADGELSAVEVTEAALTRAERFAEHNLFITAPPERAREAAAAADRAWATGGPLGPLHGVPITVKDNIDVDAARRSVPCYLADLTARHPSLRL